MSLKTQSDLSQPGAFKHLFQLYFFQIYFVNVQDRMQWVLQRGASHGAPLLLGDTEY